jgi:hypothetical protein
VPIDRGLQIAVYPNIMVVCVPLYHLRPYSLLTSFVLCSVRSSQVLFQFFGFSKVADGLGVLRCFRLASLLCGPLVFFIPYLSSAPKNIQVPALVVLILLSRLIFSLAFSALSVVINNSVTSSDRARVNGVAMAIGSLAKAAGPLSASLMYAWSLEDRAPAVVDYHLTFNVIALLALGSCVLSYKFVPDDIVDRGRAGGEDVDKGGHERAAWGDEELKEVDVREQ